MATKKQGSATSDRVLQVIKRHFREGKVLSYEAIGDYAGISRETARTHSVKLEKRRLLKRKNGNIVSVK